MKHFYIFVCVFFFGSGLCTFQEARAQLAAADSLMEQLDQQRDPQTRIDLLQQASYNLFDFEDSLALAYAHQSLQQAQAINYKKGIKYGHILVGLGDFSFGEFRNAFKEFRRADSVKAQDADGLNAYNFTLMGKVYMELAEYDSASAMFHQSLALLSKSPERKDLANIYRNLAQLYLLQWQNDSAYFYLRKAAQFLKGLNQPYLQTEIYSLMGIYYENKLNYDSSKRSFEKMCDFARAEGDYLHGIRCELNMADLDFRTGEFSKSLLHCVEALRLTNTYKYPPVVADVYIKFGNIYGELSQHDISSNYYFNALRITESHGLRAKTADIYLELAWINYERKLPDQALSYLEKSQTIREKIRDRKGLGSCHNVRGLVYFQQGKFDEAEREFEIAQVIWTAIGYEEGISSYYYNSSLLLFATGNEEQGLAYQKKAIELESRTGNRHYLSMSYNNLGNYLTRFRQFDEARDYLLKARQLALETKSKLQMMYNNRYLAQLYAAMGDYRKAYGYQAQYIQLNDSVYSQTSSVKQAEMEAMYQVEKKDQAIQLLSQQRQIQQNEISLQRAQLERQWTYILSGAVALLFLVLLTLLTYQYNRKIRKANRAVLEQKEEIEAQSEELIEANQALSNLNDEIQSQRDKLQAQALALTEANEAIYRSNLNLEQSVQRRTMELKQAYHELDTFFYRSSHDFRRPITTFLGLAEVAKLTLKDPGGLELFDKVRITATNLDKMLWKLQSISELAHQQMVFKEVLLRELIDDVLNSQREHLLKGGIRTEVDMDLTSPFVSYPALVKIIVENLIENAVAFRGSTDPFIRISVHSENGLLLLVIVDNGQGIDPEYQGRIFEMYFRATERSTGSGLGLYIVRKAVESLKGSITFETKVHQGSKFVVRLPLSQ